MSGSEGRGVIARRGVVKRLKETWECGGNSLSQGGIAQRSERLRPRLSIRRRVVLDVSVSVKLIRFVRAISGGPQDASRALQTRNGYPGARHDRGTGEAQRGAESGNPPLPDGSGGLYPKRPRSRRREPKLSESAAGL